MSIITLHDSTSLFEIRGGRRAQRDKLVGPLLWSKNTLIPRHSVHVEVVLKDLGPEYCGFCMMDGDDLYKPREFVIELNKKCENETILLTLFHEMVHLKQYVRNELQIRSRPTVHRKWKGEQINEDLDYYSLPWEKEAYKVQNKLMKQWIKETYG